MRRMHIIQRSAGKLFYQWAEALGARLEEMLLDDKRRIPEIVQMVTDESKQKDLLKADEEEDFLDEGLKIHPYNIFSKNEHFQPA